ncbi:MAG: hypothetical protein R2813_01990 [Flavobacteriales bacterium]
MKKLILLTGIIVTVSSCGLLWVFRQLHEMPDMTWRQSDIQTFNAEIKESGNYNVVFLFRHVHGFPYKDVGIRMQMRDSQTDEMFEYSVPIIADNKEYLGDGSGDMWDVEFPMLERHHFDAGHVEFAIEHRMAKEDLQLVMEVGIKIERAKE